MPSPVSISIQTTTYHIPSMHLGRTVTVDLYCPAPLETLNLHLLLLNDGQDLNQFHFSQMLQGILASGMIQPLVSVGIHAGADRLQEYGIASTPDYAGRGGRASAYQQFVLAELLPFVHLRLGVEQFASTVFAGFSLGGLSAFDLVWHNPEVFQMAGVFSGSFWWRSRDLGDGYSDDQHRIMHQLVRKGQYHPGQRFYFTTGALDETADRNHNGIIDSIDDTTDLVRELQQKGYDTEYDIRYINYEEGRHDVFTWGKAMPGFLLSGFAKSM